MFDYYPFLAPLLHELNPEKAHRLAILALRFKALPYQPLVNHLAKIGTMRFANPVGLAAGFDKNGEVVASLFNQGFGFVECGTVTPRPQEGNPKPRLFRLKPDEAIINRLGFNNAGLEALKRNIDRQGDAIAKARQRSQRLGINIGKNKDSDDAVADYVTMMDGVLEFADYITLNISSPNTPGLRDLQAADALKPLLDAACNRRAQHTRRVALWLKLAPDLEDGECEAIARTLEQYPIDALVIGNTTISRPPELKGRYKAAEGGLSGKPLMALSTQRLQLFSALTMGKIPLVGVGGIASPEDAKAKREAGATLVQLYTALIYQGFALVPRIASAF